jgi:hypothetical protein
MVPCNVPTFFCDRVCQIRLTTALPPTGQMFMYGSCHVMVTVAAARDGALSIARYMVDSASR